MHFFNLLSCSVLPAWQRPKRDPNWHLVACQAPDRSLRGCYSLCLLTFIFFVEGHRWKVAVWLSHSCSPGAGTDCRVWHSTPWVSDATADFSASHYLFLFQSCCQSFVWTLHSGWLRRQTKRSKSRQYAIWPMLILFSQRLFGLKKENLIPKIPCSTTSNIPGQIFSLSHTKHVRWGWGPWNQSRFSSCP